MNNYVVRSYRDVIVITKFATRRASKSTQYGLIKLTRGVCRGLPCCAASFEKLFSFLGKDNHGSPWLM